MRASPLLLWTCAAPLSFGAFACERRASVAPPAAMSTSRAPDAGATPGALPYATPPPTDVFAPPADAERDASGVARKILKAGTGTERPTATGTFVELRYAGWERNGRQFEGSAADGTPARYDMTDFAEGLRRELTLMVPGERRRIWVPAALAYGKRTNFANAPKGDMTFEVELVRVIPLPPAPKSVAGAPKDAKTTSSGLAYEVLDKGGGKKHPTEESRAEVTYTAWTPDGHMFQTSLLGGDTGTVKVKLLPPGWREAMLRMVEGDRWRLWLPGKLAFGELPPGETPVPFGPPPGPVVFEVKLIKLLD